MIFFTKNPNTIYIFGFLGWRGGGELGEGGWRK